MKTLVLLLLCLAFVSAYSQKQCDFSIDTPKILQNKNLNALIDSLQTAPIFTKFDIKYIPKAILKALKCWTGKFTIANPGQPYQVGCLVQRGLPQRQLLYLGFNKNYFVMTYKSGGIGTFYHIVIFKYENNRILDFWCGYGSEMRSTNEVLSYLSKFQKQLRTNVIHL